MLAEAPPAVVVPQGAPGVPPPQPAVARGDAGS
jgi:hypothetical protein